MDQPVDLPQALLDEQQEADDLDPAAGTARAAADEAAEDQQDAEEDRPFVKGRGAESGGGGDGDRVE